MNIEILKIILKELDKGKGFKDISELYQIIHNKLSKEQSLIFQKSARVWWDNLNKFIFFTPSGGVNEISIDSSGVINEKVENCWKRNDIQLTSEEVRIIQSFLIHLHNIEINHKRPFVSFSGKSHTNQYRFTMQIIQKYPATKIKTFIRVFKKGYRNLEDFQITQSIMSQVMQSNIVISGATGSGKTTFLKSMFRHLPKNQHHIIIEDLNELEQDSVQFTHLCTHQTGLTMDQLVTNALRMSPDRIILGEIRSIEIVSFILALNSGHTGSMATIHGNSALETIYRIAELIQIYGKLGTNSIPQILKVVTRNIDHVIYLENKQVKEIIKIKGSSDKGAPFYETVYAGNKNNPSKKLLTF